MTPEIKLQKALSLLEEYEQWEADLISDNRCWEPTGMAINPTLTNELYEKLIDLQSKRNLILNRIF